MATTIFSWSDSSGVKSGSSSGGAEVELSRSSGETIPSNATITSVSWYARAGCSRAGTSSQWSFNRFKVDNTDTYPTLTSKSGESGSSSRYWRFYGTSSNYSVFQGKSSLQCIFGISNSVGNGTYTSFLYAAEVTVNWEYSYDWNYGPSNISVTQNNDGTFNISWNAASWQGPGTVYYYVYSIPGDEREWLTSTTSTSATNILIPAYGNVTIYVYGYEYDTYTESAHASKAVTFLAPSLSKPTISLSTSKGQSVIITRGSSSITKGSATSISYKLFRGSTEVGTFSGTTYTLDQATLESWGQTSFTFKIQATATGVTPVVNNISTLTAISDTATFTFEPYKTILYYTGNGPINGYEECIAYYYTGNSNEGNNGWVECEPYIYTGESNATINGWQLCSYT